MVTGLYAAVFALMQVWLTLQVALRRKQHSITYGHGDNDDLARHIHVSGNFAETVPMALFLMLVLEGGGLGYWVIHALGVAMLISRILHAVGVLRGSGTFGIYKRLSVWMTLGVYVVAAILCVMMFLPFYFGLPVQYG
ncbi:MAG: glutathione S-transferase [Micavibrio sp.]|nr:MAG: glutathione S-transferase [Micavibrio sp.]